MNSKTFIVAIDGPNGSGKSTLAKKVAHQLGITYVDTGAMYRAVAYYFVKNNIVINEENAKKYVTVPKIDLEFKDGNTVVILDGEDISSKIRMPEITMASTSIASLLPIRQHLVSLQRKMATEKSIVMEGRDIASVVFPNADVKIYLTADEKVRAKRRYNDYLKLGRIVILTEVEEEILKRDFEEMNRKNSPLIKVEDAILLDNTDLNFEETVELAVKIIKSKLKI